MVSMKPTIRNGMVQFVGIALLICFWAMGKSASRNRLLSACAHPCWGVGSS
jgi:hypothetical protein